VGGIVSDFEISYENHYLFWKSSGLKLLGVQIITKFNFASNILLNSIIFLNGFLFLSKNQMRKRSLLLSFGCTFFNYQDWTLIVGLLFSLSPMSTSSIPRNTMWSHNY
jgi:hypothetical protein